MCYGDDWLPFGRRTATEKLSTCVVKEASVARSLDDSSPSLLLARVESVLGSGHHSSFLLLLAADMVLWAGFRAKCVRPCHQSSTTIANIANLC